MLFTLILNFSGRDGTGKFKIIEHCCLLLLLTQCCCYSTLLDSTEMMFRGISPPHDAALIIIIFPFLGAPNSFFSFFAFNFIRRYWGTVCLVESTQNVCLLLYRYTIVHPHTYWFIRTLQIECLVLFLFRYVCTVGSYPIDRYNPSQSLESQ